MKNYGLVLLCLNAPRLRSQREVTKAASLQQERSNLRFIIFVTTLFIWPRQYLDHIFTALSLIVCGVKQSRSFGRSWNPTPRQPLRGSSQAKFLTGYKDAQTEHRQVNTALSAVTQYIKMNGQMNIVLEMTIARCKCIIRLTEVSCKEKS